MNTPSTAPRCPSCGNTIPGLIDTSRPDVYVCLARMEHDGDLCAFEWPKPPEQDR